MGGSRSKSTPCHQLRGLRDEVHQLQKWAAHELVDEHGHLADSYPNNARVLASDSGNCMTC